MAGRSSPTGIAWTSEDTRVASKSSAASSLSEGPADAARATRISALLLGAIDDEEERPSHEPIRTSSSLDEEFERLFEGYATPGECGRIPSVGRSSTLGGVSEEREEWQGVRVTADRAKTLFLDKVCKAQAIFAGLPTSPAASGNPSSSTQPLGPSDAKDYGGGGHSRGQLDGNEDKEVAEKEGTTLSRDPLARTLARVRAKIFAVKEVNLLTGDLRNDAKMMQDTEEHSATLRMLGSRRRRKQRTVAVSASDNEW